MAKLRAPAQALVTIPKKGDRKAELRKLITSEQLKSYSLPTAVADGVWRDVMMAVSSYVELKAGGHEAEWPEPQPPVEADYLQGLEDLAVAQTLDEERCARDRVFRLQRRQALRPMTLRRSRECRLVRQEENGRISAVLMVSNHSWSGGRKSLQHAGIDATTGETLKASKSECAIIVPVACSKWHEQKFLSGRAILRSCQIQRQGDRWFMYAQLEMAAAEPVTPETVLGVDRGLKRALSAASVTRTGEVRHVSTIAGTEFADAIRAAERRGRAYQRRTGRIKAGHREHVQHLLHKATNEIVAQAKAGRAEVAFEKLDGFKRVIVGRRPKGARRNPWAKSLKKMQMGKLETMLSYKLALAGLPPLREVFAAGTSQTCPGCGHRDPKNRPGPGEPFNCTSCGLAADSDDIGAVMIARRGALGAAKKITKGSKLDDLHKDMVAGLAGHRGGGLGPLVAGVASGFVAAHGSGGQAHEDSSESLTSRRTKNSTHVPEKTASAVFAERSGLISVDAGKSKSLSSKGDAGGRSRPPPK